MQYVKDTAVPDTTPPPAPTNLRVNGNELTWEAEADLESGLASFIIERDGEFLANVPEQRQESLRPPRLPGPAIQRHADATARAAAFTDTKAESGRKHAYRVIAVNTTGLKSQPSADSVAGRAR